MTIVSHRNEEAIIKMRTEQTVINSENGPDSPALRSVFCAARGSSRGVTMIEVIVTMLILGILVQTAWSSLTNTKASFDRNAARQSFEFDLRRARSEALSKGVRVIITVAADGKSYTVGNDLLPYDLVNGNYDAQLFKTNLPSGVTLAFSGSGSDATKLIFTSRGFLSDIGGNRTTSQRTATLTQNGKVFTTATMYPVGVAMFSS